MREIKKRLLVALMPLLILVIALGSIACAGEESGGGTPTPTATPVATPVTHENTIGYAIETFQRFPVEWDRARYINLEMFRKDTTLKTFYDDIHGLVGQDLSAVGIDLNKVDHVSFVIGHAAVYSGNLNLDDIRQELVSLNYSRNVYLDTEIWTSWSSEKGTITLLQPNSVLVTNNREEAELCLSVVKGWGRSLYDNNNIEDVIARLPENLLRMEVSIGTDPGLLAAASTVEKAGSETVKVMNLSKFTDDTSAKNSLEKMSATFNTLAGIWKMVGVENVQIRAFIKSSGTANIEDVRKVHNLLGYNTYWLH